MRHARRTATCLAGALLAGTLLAGTPMPAAYAETDAALSAAPGWAAGAASRSTVAAAVAASPADTPSSSAILGLLPDGATKRRFILDCTGCHQMDMARTFPNGGAQTVEEWEASIQRMLAMAGAASLFPVISAERDAAATARWLAGHLSAPPEPAVPGEEAEVVAGAAGTEAAAVAADAPAAPVREYDYPYPGDLPHDLAVDSDGRVVITGMFTHRMLRLDPETGEYEEFPIPVQQANPRALEIDGDGNWWALLGAPNAAARYAPDADEWRHWPIGVYGHSIRVDGEGRAWFNGHFTADPPMMGYLDPATGDVHTFEVPLDPAPDAQNPIPYGLRVAPDGAVYGTELHGNRLVRLDPATGAIRAWMLPTSHSGPRRPDVAPDGVVWIPLYSANALARFDPATESFTEYQLPVADALPYIVQVDRRGKIVVGTAAADAVLRFDPATSEWETFPLPTRGVLIRHMDLDPRTGDLWVAYAASPGIPAKIARVGLGGG